MNTPLMTTIKYGHQEVALELIDAKWDRLCEEFLSFHKENGHSDVPTKNTELYRWTTQQKENHESFDQCELDGTKANTERKRRLHSLKGILA